jgi:hypothetical protein
VSYHIFKDEVRLAWLDNRDQVNLDLRKVMRRVQNEVLKELEDQFLEGIRAGEILELRPATHTLLTLMSDKAKLLAKTT